MNRERWQEFNIVLQAHNDLGAKIADRWHQSASELSEKLGIARSSVYRVANEALRARREVRKRIVTGEP